MKTDQSLSKAYYFYNKQKQKGYLDLSIVSSKNGRKIIAPNLIYVSEELSRGYISPELSVSFWGNNENINIYNNPILVLYKTK